MASADHLAPLPVEENFDCETNEESCFEPGERLDLPTYLLVRVLPSKIKRHVGTLRKWKERCVGALGMGWKNPHR